ncbi:MAG: PIN domain-containing protein [Euryarchaeota archaeon]|nr:PIN domain-containing protein [Euryarchaeota archaeon]
MELLYLDTCVWGRTLDELTQPRIRREFEAVLEVLDAASRGRVSLLYSKAVEWEVSGIPLAESRDALKKLMVSSRAKRAPRQAGVRALALRIERQCGVGGLDAVHIAFAIHNRATRFLTVDDAILKRGACIDSLGIRAQNPVTYIGELHDI